MSVLPVAGWVAEKEGGGGGGAGAEPLFQIEYFIFQISYF